MADCNHPRKKPRQGTLLSFFKKPDPPTVDELPHSSAQANISSPPVSQTNRDDTAAAYVPSNDIGLAVGKHLNQEDRIRFIEPWRPPTDADFPSSVRQSDKASKTGAERRRRLLPRHLDTFKWLAVSQHTGMEGVFCIPCVLFHGGSRVKGQPQCVRLVSVPLAKFDDLTGKDGVLSRHQNTSYHQRSVQDMEDFKRVVVSRTQADIHSSLDERHKREIEQNRDMLRPIVDTILTCARQNIAFRGHRGEVGAVSAEGIEPPENDGNFRALLRYRIRGGDNALKDHVQKAKANATYHSPHIQNALITAAGDLVKENVLHRIKKACFWAIIADETTDRHHREQLAVIIRYVLCDAGTWKCYEDPIVITDIFANIEAERGDDVCNEIRLSGQAIGKELLRIVKELGLALANCVGQGYDGASALSSQRTGASQRFMEEATNAHYFHCSMHCLNLSAAKAATTPSVRHAQEIVKEAVSFFRSSAKRSGLLKKCIEKCEDTRISKSHLMTMCTTRFIERHTSVVCFRSLLRFIVESLSQMTTWQSSEARKKAHTLMHSISQTETVIGLVVLENISSIMLPTTRLLQTEGIDLVNAMSGVDDMLAMLESLRSSERFGRIFEEAQTVAELLGITLTKPRTARRSVYRATASSEDASVEDYYRINAFYPTLDDILQDLRLRFGPKQQQAANFSRAVPAFMDFSDEEGDWRKLEMAVNTYIDRFPDALIAIQTEYELWRRKWAKQPSARYPRTALTTLDHCSMYPNISIILQLLATLPVTTAEAERVFSKVERTLTAIRASMEEERLEALILLQVHRGDTPAIDAVIDRFATTSARRLKFVI